MTAIVRLIEDGRSQFVQVRINGKAFAVSGESEIDAALLGFARASIDVLERLKPTAEPKILRGVPRAAIPNRSPQERV